ncbi:DUF3046 domain-containing protein [Cryobacterium sp. Sr8]|uniref:DUF3046 domain-containing protein n=1 Tax=Cryobacterium sp. Sr8 TaxID=1259203 RepID=UPI00106CBFA8|nr:DUF3046 domain-containing protein [Cryobacterium sp. Sr8]TFD82070.1 DUF3046 domain-containing protein [Cryobacterium sp. Sr8]
MRLSEFRQALKDEFGDAYGRVLTRDLVLTPLGGRTADQALAGGTPARDVWLALCAETDVPKSRWYGAGLPAPHK